MHSGAKVLIGAAAVGLLAYVCHGPLGMGHAFMDALAGNAKNALTAVGGTNVAVAFQQEPLARLAVLSGPITDKAEQAKYVAAVRGAFGVHDARWTAAPVGLATLPPAAQAQTAASPAPMASVVPTAAPAPATATPDIRPSAPEPKPEAAAKPIASATRPAASGSGDKGDEVARCQSGLEAAADGKTIGFRTGQARLSASGRALVATLAAKLKTCSAVKIEVGGHTDSVGTKKANQRLSEARARTVIRALIAKGVPKALLIAKGYGASVPLATGSDAAARATNRRIAFTIMSAS